MSGNQQRVKTLRSIRTSREEEMAAFDMLPPVVRQSIAEAPFKYSALGFVRSFRSGKLDIDEVPQCIRNGNRAILADTEMLRVWGDHHPQALATGLRPKTLKELDL